MNMDMALQILNTDRLRNINIINFMKQYPIKSVDIEGQSVMVRGTSDKNWVYLSSKSETELLSLINRLSRNDDNFAVVEDWMVPYILKDSGKEENLTCIKLYLPDNVSLPACKCKISELSVEDAEYIYDNYKYQNFTCIEYIKDRITRGIGLGIYESNKLTAWIITHDDGAMGFLNVLPEYRRRGYGLELTVSLVQKLRAAGEIPFVHIEEGNIKSMSLALKLGFVKDRRVNWFKRI